LVSNNDVTQVLYKLADFLVDIPAHHNGYYNIRLEDLEYFLLAPESDTVQEIADWVNGS
jgi:hypothetical protein